MGKKLRYNGNKFDLRRTQTIVVTKPKTLLFIMKKPKVMYQKKVFEQIYSFRTLIFYGKAMVLWKNYGTIKKQWFHGKIYGSVPKTMEL